MATASPSPSAEPRRVRFGRYVAVGDSSTEGLDDPDGAGGYRGWADRFAAHIASAQGSVLYANLAVRGRRTRRVLEEQLEAATALRPDLATVFTGTNDVVARRFDAEAIGSDVELMQRRLIECGATVLSFTLPDLTAVMPLGRLARGRVRRLNEACRRASASTGAILVDLAAHPVAGDPRLWSPDRLHANARGHARMADALADALGLPGAGRTWLEPLPTLPVRTPLRRLGDELSWGRRYLLPWIWRRLRGRSSGDDRKPKRPELVEVRATGSSRIPTSIQV